MSWAATASGRLRRASESAARPPPAPTINLRRVIAVILYPLEEHVQWARPHSSRRDLVPDRRGCPTPTVESPPARQAVVRRRDLRPRGGDCQGAGNGRGCP